MGCNASQGFIPGYDLIEKCFRSDYLRLLKVLPSKLPINHPLPFNETIPITSLYTACIVIGFSFGKTNSYDRTIMVSYIDIFPLEKDPCVWLG